MNDSRIVDAVLVSLAAYLLQRLARTARRRLVTTRLRGPPSVDIVTGVGSTLLMAKDASILYDEWATEFGPVFSVPSGLFASKIVLCDPKAATHVYARDTAMYHRPQAMRDGIASIAGHNLLWAEGEDHKRHRRAMIPAFSNASIRKLTPAFIDAGYKVKEAWEGIIAESTEKDSAVIDIQTWMGRISLDSIGIAGFSHDFGSLSGAHPAVNVFFDALNEKTSSVKTIRWPLLEVVKSWPDRLSGKSKKFSMEMSNSLGEAAEPMLERVRQEKAGEVSREDKSIIGLLVKSESLGEGAEMHMSPEEVLSQMKLLIFAGKETTSAALTMALVRLSQNQDAQTKLRDELSKFATSDPTYEQLTNGLPYLDAVITESLRLMASGSISDFTRVAGEDDVIPLSHPVRDASGKLVDSIVVAKGTLVCVSISYMNRSPAIWGRDSREFRPERWLDEDGLPSKAKEIQGHRHILTFSDGQRACLGKQFALAELKAVLSVLIRYFVLEMEKKGGEVERAGLLSSQLKIVGEDGVGVPLRIRRVD
ncbi:cytochrome P450 [Coniophora puteana RWD-64-598 SS2]|uniref:Cytochrome P450 n=1 Tax=Coniophora puteana (strain RWD-64-598) TaxID=741705 RepID=A0A5M3MFX0_CONPW|nr:cytochrome P450 [Coniophora puteana RWD-64-598 SS2]EIW77664.1 cytochrome P450 [Coniophora puteana RWD-64-598 SS2]